MSFSGRSQILQKIWRNRGWLSGSEFQTAACDTNHLLESDYSEVIVVGAGADAVDYKLISICHKGDIVVSQDYGGGNGIWKSAKNRVTFT